MNVKMRQHPIIFAISSLFILHAVTSEECAVSVRPQSEVRANWNGEVPDEWSRSGDFSGCKLKLYRHYG